MPALGETQSPFFIRDLQCGTIPSKVNGETNSEYYYRLSRRYFLSLEEITRVLSGTS